MGRARVLILKMGSAHPRVVDRCGDYEDWFLRALESHPRRREFEVAVHPAWDSRFQEAECVILSGSRRSVYDNLGWLDTAKACLEHHIETGNAVLGVCFGHQLLARMFGGTVSRNRAGLTMGARVVELTEDGRRDPLFRGLPDRFVVEETHGDIVTYVPGGAQVLVTSPHDPNHGFRLAENVWTVQFHPEMGLREAGAVRSTHEAVRGGRDRVEGVAKDDATFVDPLPRPGTHILHRLIDIALF